MKKLLLTAAIMVATATGASAAWTERMVGKDYYAVTDGTQAAGSWFNDATPMFIISCRQPRSVSIEVDFGDEVLAKDYRDRITAFVQHESEPDGSKPFVTDVLNWSSLLFVNQASGSKATGLAARILKFGDGKYAFTTGGVTTSPVAVFNLTGFNEHFKKAAWACGFPFGK